MANNTFDRNLKKQRYICCFVPLCQNNNKKNPNTLFFHVPNNEEVKKKWFRAAHREFINTKTVHYCCQDHFDVEIIFLKLHF